MTFELIVIPRIWTVSSHVYKMLLDGTAISILAAVFKMLPWLP